MASNILSIPFRRTHPVCLADALKQYISEKYDQHPDMFRDDLSAIDSLRTDAVTILEAHTSGIRKISQYAAQLVWIGGKFPIDIGVEFQWYPALGFNTARTISESNLRFELANILFNLAALYSQLALSLNRSTEDGLKVAGNYFSLAAGVFQYLKSDIIPEMRSSPPEDMDLMTLESLEHVMLAQAQECSWLMAVKKGLKDATIAKLAAKVSDFYDQAAEHGTRSDTVSTDWIHHMSAKHHHFAAAAQYRAACDCLEKRKYGEEVARLRDSVTCVTEGLKEAKWISKAAAGDLNGLKQKVTEDLKRAEKDNDMIYLMPVPPKSELQTLERRAMVTAKPPSEVSDPASSLGDNKPFGLPLFARLVPYSVHVAASIYADRRDRIVNNSIIDELEKLTDQVRDLLQSLNLPGSLQALEKPLGLPPSVTSHAEEIRQQGGVHRLRRTMRDVESLKENDVRAFKEGVSLLQTEAAEDEHARARYGTDRWTRAPSQQDAKGLHTKVTEIDGYLSSAAASDELVKNKLKDCENVLRVFEGTDRDLENYVPSSRKQTMSPRLEKDASRLRSILNEINRLESRRRRKAESLREKAKADDINSVLLAETTRLEREFPLQQIEAVQFEGLFEKRLQQRYDEDLIMVNDEREDQEHLAAQLREANTAFSNASKGETTSKEREQALQRLENGYLKYKEIMSNLDAARKFYNDLAKIVNLFRDESQQYRYQRRLEAGTIEADLSNAMSALSMSQTSSLQDQKERESLRSQLPAPVTEPLAAPIPTRAHPSPAVWSPEMGIKFGGHAPIPAENAQHNPPYPNPGARNGRWSPSHGIRFG